MSSQDEKSWGLRRLLNDADYNRTVARCHAGSASTPRQPPLAGWADHGGHLSSIYDAAEYAEPEYADYTTSSASARASRIFADRDYDDDHDSYHEPADFMRAAGISSQPGVSSDAFRHSAEYRASSSHPSKASSVVPSIFDRASASRSSAMSSLPPGRDDITNFTQTLVAMAAADIAHLADAQPIAQADAQLLWCELSVLQGCAVTFPINRMDEWVEHHCTHLAERFPARLQCWFCDDVTFTAESNSRHGRYANFRDRMMHIWQHIYDEYMMMDAVRPDFYMIKHLGEMGIVEPVMRDHALAYSELPPALRLSGSNTGANTQPHNQWQRPPGPALAHDLARERRQQRGRGGQRHRHATVQHL